MGRFKGVSFLFICFFLFPAEDPILRVGKGGGNDDYSAGCSCGISVRGNNNPCIAECATKDSFSNGEIGLHRSFSIKVMPVSVGRRDVTDKNTCLSCNILNNIGFFSYQFIATSIKKENEIPVIGDDATSAPGVMHCFVCFRFMK